MELHLRAVLFSMKYKTGRRLAATGEDGHPKSTAPNHSSHLLRRCDGPARVMRVLSMGFSPILPVLMYGSGRLREKKFAFMCYYYLGGRLPSQLVT